MASCGITTESLTLRILSGSAAGFYEGTHLSGGTWSFATLSPEAGTQVVWDEGSDTWEIWQNSLATGDVSAPATCAPFLATWAAAPTFPGSPAVELYLTSDPPIDPVFETDGHVPLLLFGAYLSDRGLPLVAEAHGLGGGGLPLVAEGQGADGGLPLAIGLPLCGLLAVTPRPSLLLTVLDPPLGAFVLPHASESPDGTVQTWAAVIGAEGGSLLVAYPAPGWNYQATVVYDAATDTFLLTMTGGGEAYSLTHSAGYDCSPLFADLDQSGGDDFGHATLGLADEPAAAGGLALVLEATAYTRGSALPLVAGGLAAGVGGLALALTGRSEYSAGVPLAATGGVGAGMNLVVTGYNPVGGGLALVTAGDGPAPLTAGLALVAAAPGSETLTSGMNLALVGPDLAGGGLPLALCGPTTAVTGGLGLAAEGADTAGDGLVLAAAGAGVGAARLPLYARGW